VAPLVAPGRAAHTEARGYDHIIPHEARMGRASYFDVDGVERHPNGRISQSETVWTALQVLYAAQRAPVPPGGDRPLSSYLDIQVEAVGNPIFPVPADYGEFLRNHAARAKAALEAEFAVLERSATLRQLLRYAAHAGRVSTEAGRRWTLRVVPPAGFRNGLAVFRADFVPDMQRRTLTVPSMESPLLAGRYYLAAEGGVTPLGASCATMHAIVSILTGVKPRQHAAWMDGAGGIDPRRIRELGVGERGAVGYLVQRMVRELFPSGASWLSGLPFGDSNLASRPHPSLGIGRLNDETRLALNEIGGVSAVARYVHLQDEYLEGRCPLAEPAPIPASTSAPVQVPTPRPRRKPAAGE
jgi:hypothetical protein